MDEREWSKNPCFGESDKAYKENQKFFLDFFTRERSDPKLLDLGCYNGDFTLQIASRVGAKNVHGVELEKDWIRQSRKNGVMAKPADLNGRFPFPDASFDVLSANQILEHLWNTDNFFREANRILKKGGYAVVSTPNLSSFHSMFFILLGQQTPVIHLTDIQVGNFLKGTKMCCNPHVKVFNIPALKDLGEYYGFKVERIGGFGFYFLPLAVQKMLSKVLGRYAVFITMRIRKVRDL